MIQVNYFLIIEVYTSAEVSEHLNKKKNNNYCLLVIMKIALTYI